MEDPFIRIEESGAVVPLSENVTTIGRGCAVDVRLSDPSVSRLHAEIVRRGPYAYVSDLGLSRNGTRVNGRLVARRVLEDGDVLTFGSARCRVGGIAREDFAAEVELRRSAAPALTDEAFVAPATAREIASDLVVTEAAVKQHLLRLYQKFRIPEGTNRRVRLANEVVALGLLRPLPVAERTEIPQPRSSAERGDQASPERPTSGREKPRQPRAAGEGSSPGGNGADDGIAASRGGGQSESQNQGKNTPDRQVC